MHLQPRSHDALIVIDPQNDFCPGGALAVADGNAIMAPISELSRRFGLIVVTQDWHPGEHASFAANHPGAQPFASIAMPYGPQVLWPNHCVQGTRGADFHPGISEAVARANLILRKGTQPHIDSYSAFFENDKATATGLAGYLRDRNVKRCVFVGLAFDFCVAWSALDAVRLGFAAAVVQPLTRAIAMPTQAGRTTSDDAERDLRAHGIEVLA